MIRDYLFERKKKLQEIVDINTNKHDHNQIAIEKNEKQIKELINEVDEATNIFSVVAREDSGFKSKEIAEIEEKIAVYIADNIEIKKIINQAKEEIETINICIDELDNEEKEEIVVETTSMNSENKENSQMQTDSFENIINKEIVDKLKLCKTLVEIDPRRTIIELDNIIKKYE